ncbi:MAG: hypothetical protein IPQ28_10395 [Sphingobacteriales bacterium]|nr:hypothetical protein [Sphingobacteriales bacterium]
MRNRPFRVKKSGICIVTAWACEQRLVLGQQKGGSKEQRKDGNPELWMLSNWQAA